MHRNQIGAWTLAVDDHLMRRIAGLRAAKLPNETGGVLIGAYDLICKIVYVVETIPSPPDSKEWPTLYSRLGARLCRHARASTHRTGTHRVRGQGRPQTSG